MQVRELLDNPAFQTGFGIGVATLLVAVVLVGARAVRQRGSAPGPRSLPPLAGIGIVAGAAIAFLDTGVQANVGSRLVVGLVLLLVGPFAVAIALDEKGASPVLTMLAAVPGAAVVAWAASVDNPLAWIPWLLLVTTLGGGALVADFDGANARAGMGPMLFAIAVLGMYSTLPDTEPVAVVVGVALPLALLGTPFALASIGPGAYGMVGLVGWVAAVGGRGRAGSVVAAIACLGLMLVEPFVRRMLRERIGSLRRPLSAATLGVLVIQIGLVLVIARVAGLRTSATSAAGISALLLAIAAAALAALLAAWGGRVRGGGPDADPPQSDELATSSTSADQNHPSAS